MLLSKDTHTACKQHQFTLSMLVFLLLFQCTSDHASLLISADSPSSSSSLAGLNSLLSSNYYDLLGLPFTRSAPAASILKRAYRSAALIYHPDKYSDAKEREQANRVFVRIAAAYETLSSTDKREDYNRMLEFGLVDYDEISLREWRHRMDDLKYGRWRAGAYRAMSGDWETSDLIEFILGLFISFLCIFIPVYYYVVSTYKKRVAKLQRAVEFRQQIMDTMKERGYVKNRDKMIKNLEQRKRMAESTLVEDESRDYVNQTVTAADSSDNESDSEQQQRQQQRQLKQQQRKLNKQLRTQFKQLLQLLAQFSVEEVELMLNRLSVEEMQKIMTHCQHLKERSVKSEEQNREEIVKILTTQLRDVKCIIEDQEESRRKAEASTTTSKLRHSISQTPAWDSEEQSLLAKGMSKYVGGTLDRWLKITDFINQNKTDKSWQRTLKEVIQRGRVADMGVKVDGQKAFESFMMEKKKNKESSATSTNTGSTSNRHNSSTSTDSTTLNAMTDEVTDWSAQQQSELESALTSIPRDAVDRWDLIAAQVAGKTKQDCIQRVKFIRQQIQQAKRTT